MDAFEKDRLGRFVDGVKAIPVKLVLALLLLSALELLLPPPALPGVTLLLLKLLTLLL